MIPARFARNAPPTVTLHSESDPLGLSPSPTPQVPVTPASFSLPADRLETQSVGDPRLRALIELLEDDSPTVRASVRQALRATGRRAFAPLQRAIRNGSPRLRGRARELSLEMERDGVLRRLLRRAADPTLDLESSLLLLARIEDPAFDARPYRRVLEAMGKEVKQRAAAEPDDFTRPMVLSEYLGNELGFVGAEVDFDHPDHIHLHRTLETKRGMPLTLSAIYLFVARRAGLDAAILPLPGHVLLRLYSGRRALIIDPFHGGRIRRRADCLRYLAQHGMVPKPNWFHDATDTAMFQRHLLNLMSSMHMRGRVRLAGALHAVAQTAAGAVRGSRETS